LLEVFNSGGKSANALNASVFNIVLYMGFEASHSQKDGYIDFVKPFKEP
jgi:hypothetical protein